MKFVHFLKSRLIFNIFCCFCVCSISKCRRCFNVKSLTYCFHMKMKLLTDLQIFISVPFGLDMSSLTEIQYLQIEPSEKRT